MLVSIEINPARLVGSCLETECKVVVEREAASREVPYPCVWREQSGVDRRVFSVPLGDSLARGLVPLTRS